jgi:hypothetical protein
MPTYKDLDRTSTQSCLIAYDIYGKLWDGSYAKPPETYEFERYADFTIGGHFGCSVTITSQLFTTGSAQIPPPGIDWTWQLRAIVTVDNGHGVTNTQTLVLLSGTESNPNDPLYSPSTIQGISVAGTFSFSVGSEILYDITESQPGGAYLHPPYTVLNQYERSLVGSTATCSVTLNGQTVTATGVVSSSQTTGYNFQSYIQAVSIGSLGGVEQAILSTPTINSIAIPNLGYTFIRDAGQFVESTSVIKAYTTGADDAFGNQKFTSAEINADITLDRNIKNKGWVNAYNNTYPNSLNVNLLNFDGGTRTVTFTGSYDETETFKKYSFSSTLILVPSTLTDTVNFDDIPAGNFKNTLTSASLIANGDYQYNTRVPFRGWSYAGASLYHTKELTLSGSGNTYSFNDPNRVNFSGYRYLRVNAQSATASPESAYLWISYGNAGTYVMSAPMTIPVVASNQNKDLCFAYDLHVSPTDDIVTQDNPYPRANPNSSYDWGSQKLINKDLYGIGQVGEVRLDGNVTVNSFKLYRDDNTAKADFIAPISQSGLGFTQVFTGTASTTYNGRRFWSQDVQGRNDEEYDLLQVIDGGTTYVPQTIAGFVDNITNLTGYQGGRVHLGWTANSSTPNDSSANLRDGYLNEDGYMSWLMGFGMEYVAGNQKFAFDRDLSQEANDYDIFAQTIFDELNCDFIPDYPDPFGIETPGETALILYGFNCQRGPVHGLVQLQQLGQTVFVQDAGLINRGSSVTDVNGRYQTATPFMQAQNVNDVFCGIATTTTTAITAKRNRVAFYFPAVPTSSQIKSADISGLYQHLIGTVNSNIVTLILTETYDFSVFEYLSTNITDAANVAVAWKPLTNENQIMLVVETTSGDIKLYINNNLGTGDCTLSTVLGTGVTPAIAINNQGNQLIIFRTTTSSGSIRRILLDTNGNVIEAAANVVTGNVTTDGLACYWKDDQAYIVYNDAVSGITVIKSDDYATTFS